jgi:hypothetical protein
MTNAIIAGLIVLQALHLLRRRHSVLRNVHVQFKPMVDSKHRRQPLMNRADMR